jgi:hypothetical protein
MVSNRSKVSDMITDLAYLSLLENDAEINVNHLSSFLVNQNIATVTVTFVIYRMNR